MIEPYLAMKMKRTENFDIVLADLGLNGLTLLEGQNERKIFLHCAENTAEKSNTGFAVADQAGRPTSAPLTVHVRKPAQQAKN